MGCGWSVRKLTCYPKGIIRPPLGTPPQRGEERCYLFGVDNIRRGGVYLHAGKRAKALTPQVIPPHSQGIFSTPFFGNPPTNPYQSIQKFHPYILYKGRKLSNCLGKPATLSTAKNSTPPNFSKPLDSCLKV